MFTGIVTHIGTIISAEKRGDLRVAIECDFAGELAVGESVAVSGVCLTVVETGDGGWGIGSGEKTFPKPETLNPKPYFVADLSPETLARTAPRWNIGESVNLERSLRLGDRLSGHLVTGHVDGTAKLIEMIPSLALPASGGGNSFPSPQGGEGQGGGSYTLCLEAPPTLARFIAEKGSVTLDGVSLTVNRVEGKRFWVMIIPHTWHHTTLSKRRAGDALNLEIDLMARYVERLRGV